MGFSDFFTAAVMKLVVVNVFGGGFFGFVISYAGPYMTMDRDSRDCAILTSSEACSSMQHSAKCLWVKSGDNKGTCIFADTNEEKPPYQCKDVTPSGENKQEYIDKCAKTEHCFWDYSAKICHHDVGMTSSQQGIYNGAMTVGAIFGSFGGGPIAAKIGRKKTILVAGLIGTLSGVILHVARMVDVFSLHVLGRGISGVTSGLACVVSPMYVEEMASVDMKGPIGTTFQASITTGIFLGALVGYVVQPKNLASKQGYELRLQVLTVLTTLCGIGYVLVGLCSEESIKYIQIKLAEENPENVAAEDEDPDLALDDATYTWGQMVGPLAVASMMCLAMQLSGINAIMNYAPFMMEQIHVKGLLGNAVIMFWNCITSFVAIPVSSRVPLRMMFVTCIGIAALALLFSGICTYPGVVGKTFQTVGGFLGIFIYIAVFEIGMGPCFYILNMQLFPFTFRTNGSAYSNGLAFFFNLIINTGYPIAKTAISGGPSGDQNKGQAVCFFFFCFCAAMSFVVLFKFLYPFYDSPKGKEAIEMCAARRATSGKTA